MRILIAVIGLGVAIAACGAVADSTSRVSVESGLPGVASGWDDPALAHMIDLAAQTNSDALIVLDHGEVVVEEYFGNPEDFTRDINSAQKGVVALLVGIAQDRGLINLDDPVSDHLEPGWAYFADSEEQITIRHLLTMTSGLDARYVAVADPGAEWSYGNNAYHRLRAVLEAAAGTDIQSLSGTWLFAPLGIDGEWYLRRGWWIGARDAHGEQLMGLRMDARSLAAIGELVRNRGSWEGRQIVSADFVDEMTQPSQDLNPAYGYLWWLNGSDYHLVPLARRLPGSLVPAGPVDAAGALGAEDQKVWVSRSTGIVIVRLGDTAYGWGAAPTKLDNQLWAAVLTARAGSS